MLSCMCNHSDLIRRELTAYNDMTGKKDEKKGERKEQDTSHNYIA